MFSTSCLSTCFVSLNQITIFNMFTYFLKNDPLTYSYKLMSKQVNDILLDNLGMIQFNYLIQYFTMIGVCCTALNIVFISTHLNTSFIHVVIVFVSPVQRVKTKRLKFQTRSINSIEIVFKSFLLKNKYLVVHYIWIISNIHNTQMRIQNALKKISRFIIIVM